VRRFLLATLEGAALLATTAVLAGLLVRLWLRDLQGIR
jgi:hypothetical protein